MKHDKKIIKETIKAANLNENTVKAADEYAGQFNNPTYEQNAIKAYLAGAARKQKEVDELVNALSELYDAIDCCIDLTPELLNKCNDIIKKHQQ